MPTGLPFTITRFGTIWFVLLLCLAVTVTVFGENPVPELVVTFAGDVYLGGHLEKILAKDPAYPFLHLQDFCRRSDLFFANLETPVATRVRFTWKKPIPSVVYPMLSRLLPPAGSIFFL